MEEEMGIFFPWNSTPETEGRRAGREGRKEEESWCCTREKETDSQSNFSLNPPVTSRVN